MRPTIAANPRPRLNMVRMRRVCLRAYARKGRLPRRRVRSSITKATSFPRGFVGNHIRRCAQTKGRYGRVAVCAAERVERILDLMKIIGPTGFSCPVNPQCGCRGYFVTTLGINKGQLKCFIKSKIRFDLLVQHFIRQHDHNSAGLCTNTEYGFLQVPLGGCEAFCY